MLGKFAKVVVLLFLTVLSAEGIGNTVPRVTDGVIDLRNHNFLTDGRVNLDGEYKFAWMKFVPPTADGSHFDKTFTFPGIWNDRVIDGKTVSGDGYASFYFEVLLPEDLPILRLKLPSLASSFDLYINGEKWHSSGKVGKTAEQAVAGVGADYRIIEPKTSRLRILLHVSSFFHTHGGSWYSLELEEVNNSIRSELTDLGIDVFLVSCFFIMGFYQLFLFFFRREYSPPLYLGLYSLVFMFRVANNDDGMIFYRLFDYSYTFFKKIDYITFYLIGPSYFLFVHSMFPKVSFPKIRRYFIQWIAFAGVVAIPFISPKALNYTLVPYQIYTMVVIVTITYVLIRAMRQKLPGSSMLFYGSMVLAATAINDILFALTLIDSVYLTGFGLYVVILTQAIVLAMLFNNTFRRAEAGEQTIRKLNKDLEKHIESLDALVEERTRSIQAMLDNIPQGIFRVISKDDNLVIDDEYSENFVKIMGHSNFVYKDPFLIFKNSSLTPLEESNLYNVLTSSINENFFQFDVNSHLIPKEVILNGRDLELEISPVENDRGEVDAFLCILKDVTALKELKKVAEKQAEKATIFKEIVNNKADRLGRFLSQAQDFLEQLELYQDVALMFRKVHTMKGEASTLNLSRIVLVAHDVETLLNELRLDEDARNPTGADFQDFRTAIRAYREVYDQIFKFETGSTLVEVSHLKRLWLQISGGKLTEAKKNLRGLFEKDLPGLLRDEVEALTPLAEKLGKPPIDVQYLGDQVFFNQEQGDLIQKVFTHIFRNAIDHGIESRELRQSKGKPARGMITITSKKQDKAVEIAVTDDGAGLYLPALTRKYESLHGEEASNPEQIAQVIFQAGVSTAKQVTDISGRGVGMDAVKAFLEGVGGSIQIELERPQGEWVGFSFLIHLPYEDSLEHVA